MTRGKPGIVSQNRREIALRLVRQSRKWNWSPEFTADVLQAQLSPNRVRYGVYGPCTYCGDWIASVVDHVYPLARGGEHVQANVASACITCNAEKSDSLGTEWIGMRYAEWTARRRLEDALWADAGPDWWMRAHADLLPGQRLT